MTARGADRCALAVLAALALAIRVIVLVASPVPLLTADSGSYLLTARRWWMFAARPAGTGLFYKAVLALHDDLLAILLAQALLGVGATLLAYLLARRLDVPPRGALAAALVASVAPSALLFEHAAMSEALASFLLLAFLLALVCTVQGRRRTRDLAAVGALGSGLMLVRAALTPCLPLGIALLALERGALTERARRVGFVVGVALLPLVVYAGAARIAFGAFGVTFFDGASLFAVVAARTDCASPDRPPAIRAELCRDPSVLRAAPARILWGPPVQDAVRTRGWPAVNRELRTLARENVVRAPAEFVVGVAHRLGDALALRDEAYLADATLVELPREITSDVHRDFARWRTHRADAASWNAAATRRISRMPRWSSCRERSRATCTATSRAGAPIARTPQAGTRR